MNFFDAKLTVKDLIFSIGFVTGLYAQFYNIKLELRDIAAMSDQRHAITELRLKQTENEIENMKRQILKIPSINTYAVLPKKIQLENEN